MCVGAMEKNSTFISLQLCISLERKPRPSPQLLTISRLLMGLILARIIWLAVRALRSASASRWCSHLSDTEQPPAVRLLTTNNSLVRHLCTVASLIMIWWTAWLRLAATLNNHGRNCTSTRRKHSWNTRQGLTGNLSMVASSLPPHPSPPQTGRRPLSSTVCMHTSHWNLRAHLRRLHLTDSAQCACTQSDQTPAHALQDCGLFTAQRNQTWPEGANLITKCPGVDDQLSGIHKSEDSHGHCRTLKKKKTKKKEKNMFHGNCTLSGREDEQHWLLYIPQISYMLTSSATPRHTWT